ncbi:MAG TPA: Ig-like domain-containing protein, partial [Ilumatobacteraceae bacterium]|nr:Ig-like domain-containing protein [Ilumatobacteraceae bacterium]
KGSTCVFDWVERLALGSHLYPGSSLHTNRTNQLWSTSGIGAADVSIPVKEILPQELSKDMAAEQGQMYSWDVDKSANPTSLNFADTCLTTQGARSQQVQITVTWTRSGPTGTGDTTITTHVYATNPAHRTITVQATDRIYEGAGQDPADLLDTVVSAAVDVAAGAEDVLILTHSFLYDGTATSFNDVATATYTDKVTGIAVPGQTSAAASATTVASNDPAANASVLVTDTESITGAGLSFSVAAPSVGAFTGGYVAGASTTGPVGWQYTATNSGSVTFTKTVTVDEPRITSGSLSDTATIVGDGQITLDSDSESVAITADALVSLQINKTIPAGSLRAGESVTFDFDISGPGGFAGTAQISFSYGDPLTKSTTVSGLDAGAYTVSEQAQANWADHTPQSDTIVLPDCSGSVAFNNTTLAPALSLTKTADDESVSAGEAIGFLVDLSNSGAAGTGIAKDVTLNDPLPGGDGIEWAIDSVTGTGGYAPGAGACEITGSAPSQTLECDFGDLDPGEGVEIAISSDTDETSCAAYRNEATVNASNHAELTAHDTTEVLCPDLDVTKASDDGTVSAGEPIGFSIEVSNADAEGTGTAFDVTLSDLLPGADGIDWSIAGVTINGSGVTAGEYCSITGDAPSQTLTCDFGDMEPGDSASVHVTSDTTLDSCETLDNTAFIDADNAPEEESNEASVTIECPGLNISKEAADDLIDAGDTASFTIVVWNAGPGTAFDVTLTDTLPGDLDWSENSDDCSIDEGVLTCDFGDLGISTKDASTARVTLSAETDRTECGVLNNTAIARSNPGEPVRSSDSIEVQCPTVEIVKDNDQSASVLPGTDVTFTLIVTVADGPATDVMVVDTLPDGYDAPTLISDGGTYDPTTREITWSLGDLADGSHELTYHAAVGADVAHGTQLVNVAVVSASNSQCPDGSEPADECEDDSTVTVRVPTLVIDKVADAEVITLSGPADALVASPSVVTWTLTYSLANGPVTNAVITDEVPEGFVFLDASDGGTLVDGVVTWNLGTLTESGSVTFRTTVNTATISRVAPTVNVAVIDSDETEPDDGQDSVTVVVEPPPQGGTPTPKPSMPNTAAGIGPDGTPVTVPVELLVAFFLGSLGALTLANARARDRRR